MVDFTAFVPPPSRASKCRASSGMITTHWDWKSTCQAISTCNASGTTLDVLSRRNALTLQLGLGCPPQHTEQVQQTETERSVNLNLCRDIYAARPYIRSASLSRRNLNRHFRGVYKIEIGIYCRRCRTPSADSRAIDSGLEDGLKMGHWGSS